MARLNGWGSPRTDSVSQSLTLPSGCTTGRLSFHLHIDTDETEDVVYDIDTFTVSVGGRTLESFSNVDAANGYVLKSHDVSRFAGQTVTLRFQGVEDELLQTSFVVDDVSLQVG